MNEINNQKKDLIVLDFDNTLFYNHLQIFSMNIVMDHILPAREFFSQLNAQVDLFNSYNFAHSTRFILLTGRPRRQERLIFSVLRRKGYKINEAFFSNYNSNISHLEALTHESDFLIKYWSAKVDLINKLKHSNKYSSITIIDDDNIICTMLKELKFTVIQSQITCFQNKLFIHFTPLDQNANTHRLKEVMIPS